MDGGFHKVLHRTTHGKVNGQPIIPVTVLSIHLMGGGTIHHHHKFSASLNLWWGKELLTPPNGQVHNLIGLVHT